MKDDRVKRFADVDLGKDNGHTVIFLGLGPGEVDAIKVALYRFARNEREVFNDGNATGPNTSIIGHNAESVHKLMIGE